MKLKDASKAINAKQQQHKGSNIKAQEVAASSNDVANKQDTNIKAKTGRLQQEQPQRGSQQLGQEQQLGTIGMQPDPLLLVALHASRPRLLSIDDLLACRCVCKQWRQRLGTAFCHSIRVPHSLWTEASTPRLAACISEAVAAYPHASDLVLDAGGCRPGLTPELWQPLLQAINPWLTQQPAPRSSSNSRICSSPAGPGASCAKNSRSNARGGAQHSSNGAARSNGAAKCVHLHLQAPPSPQRLLALTQLQQLSHLRLQHTSQSLYSRHLAALSCLGQLESLVLLLSHPRLDLRSLAHQRARRVPLKMDCLSSMQRLTELQLSSQGPAGELLPDTVAAFSSPASLAALSNLRCLGISEAALPGPTPASGWLAPLTALQQLQLVQLDEPGKAQRRAGRSTAGTSTCGAGGAASGSPGSAGSLANGLLCAGGFGALAAAAAAAGRSGGSAAEQLQVLQQQQQQLQALLPGLQGQLAAQQQQQQQHSAGFGRRTSTGSGGAPAVPSGGGAGQGPVRTSSTGSSTDADSAVLPAGGASSGTAAELPPLPPLDLSGVLLNLSSLHVSNLAGERLVGLRIPSHLTRLSLHLASPCPGAVTGEQLASVVLQAAASLVSLELGLGLRFSLSGGVMRSLKRGLKSLRDLSLVEGTQDHLEGLGCWCNLRRLELVEGRCSVPLRGLYELSMRAAMGRTPGVLRYCGHVRHVEELAGRLGGALQELRLDSLAGIGGLGRTPLLADSSGDGSDSMEQQQLPPLPQQQDEPTHSSPLAQLVSLTRLEVHGERLGLLDSSSGAAIGSLQQLVVLEIVGQEAWLAPELGVKEQLGWLRGLSQLRQLRLAGVMLGRSKLAGTGSNSSSADSSRGLQDRGAAAGKSSSSKAGSGSLVPAVKGLGNGLASAGSGSNSGVSKAAVANAAAPVAAVGVVLDPAAAAARDLLVSVSLEELRRWLSQMLPYCRVWLD
uniref:F-box domain-containing protein n=1 Tax=Tetradesmus obliquus TaxID=3088 RepID=A0A383V9C8_TETOB|eukprot:jgi/Sobl393_1/6126/SZX61553.1